jgi:hypothetical protein
MGVRCAVQRSTDLLSALDIDPDHSKWDAILPESEFSDSQALLCPPSLKCEELGGSRDSYILLAKNLRDVQCNTKAWDYLVFNPKSKGRLRDFVEQHKKSRIKALKQKNRPAQKDQKALEYDLIANKGKGLVFVLRGPPGVGKTTTVEALAELLQQPLVSMETQYLASAMTKEYEIRYFFERCERWNAILLLDEAEMMLSHRDTGKQTFYGGIHNATVAGKQCSLARK